MSTSANWWIVFAAFVCVVFMFGVPTMMMPVLYSAIIDELGWTRTQVTLVATMKFSAGAVLGIVFGFLLDRLSIRKIVLTAGVVSGGAMLAFLTIQSLMGFYAVGLVLGLGSVGVMIAMKVLVSRRFRVRQGFAVGAALLGTSVAGTFTPILTDRLIDLVGWRGAVAWMSLGIWLVALPLFAFLVRENDGEAPTTDTPSDPGGDAFGEAFGEVLRSRSFWFVAVGVGLIAFVDQAVGQHLVLYLDKDIGLGRTVAAQALSSVFFISILGKVGFGWLYDKLSVRGVTVCYFLMAVSVMIAIPIQGMATLSLFALTRGLAHGGAIVDSPVLAKHCFGPKLLGRTIGVLTAFIALGFAAGPPLVGLLYDLNGTYRVAFVLLAGLSVAAGLAVLGARPVYWERHIKPARADVRPEPAMQ